MFSSFSSVDPNETGRPVSTVGGGGNTSTTVIFYKSAATSSCKFK
jgi:hypothetical protein